MSRVAATIKAPGRVHVTIDRVVLRGMEPAVRAAFFETLRAQLAGLLADRNIRAGLAAGSAVQRTPVLRLGRVETASGLAGGRMLGARVARAIAAQPAQRSVRS